jgi:hypothetical protein
MPIQYEVQEAHRLVLTRFRGRVTEAELRSYVNEVAQDKRIAPDFLKIVDMRDTDPIDMESDVMWTIARQMRRQHHIKVGKTAIVVNHDVHFGMGRMYQQASADWNPGVEVFREMEDARRWLGLNSEPP